MLRKQCALLSVSMLASSLFILGAGAYQGTPPETNKKVQEEYDKQIQPLLDRYCYVCHGETEPRAGLNLKSYQNIDTLYKNEKLWRKIALVLQERSMPPSGAPGPKLEQRELLFHWVTNTLNDSPTNRSLKNPGRTVIRRLNRMEYNNTVRDIFGVDTHPADSFPADGGGGGGFDNNADTLFIPPILLERYLVTSGEILDKARPERIFFVKPTAKRARREVAKQILNAFAYRAYRRPVEPAELAGLMSLYDATFQQMRSHESAVKHVLRALLVSPHFLFRIEQDQQSKQAYPISDYELASRISYFLWASTPDEELLRLAGKRLLRTPKVLEEQVVRMLRSPKSQAFAESFSSQWLKVKDLYTSAQPDPGKFPNYNPALRDAMYQETVRFFDAVLHEDASLLTLLDADYTFLNEDLAKHYGIEGVTGKAMRRVSLTDKRRGGVVTMASVLTLTSYPLRTSPVLRGKYLMEQILGAEVPPPPPVVQTLSQEDAPVAGLTFRQRLEQHRKKPECAGCHSRMDPLGFGLENFDAVGRWRDAIGGKTVDASGEMTTGEKFVGPFEMKQILLRQKEDFVKNLTEKLLAYALGRGLEPYDMGSVRKIIGTVKASNYRTSTLLREIIRSFPFQYRINSIQTAEGGSNKPVAVASIKERKHE